MVELGYKYAKPNQTGNRPYDPKMILSLYLYGYLHRIRSSRRLQAETTKNIEIMWLLNELKPDDKTIANFRSDNTEALKQTFRDFNLMLNGIDLYSKELTATDGCKFRANNSRKNNHNPTTLKEKIARINKQISEHLNAIEKNDQKEQETDLPNPQQCQELLKKLKDKKITYEKLLEQANQQGEVSTIDPDARLMHSGGDNRPLDVCYNAITITDSKHKLIVDFDLTNNPSDSGSLHTISEKAKEIMGVKALTNLADKGFYDGSDILVCEASGVKCLVAKPQTQGPKKAETFRRDRFSYDAALDCYVCPCGHQLRFRRMVRYRGGHDEKGRVYENYAACRSCQRRVECTKGYFRIIVRSPYQDVLDGVDRRTADNRVLYVKRCEIVEHAFGTVKAVWGFKQFLCRGLVKVRAELSLAFLAYNFRRVFNIFAADGARLAAIFSQ